MDTPKILIFGKQGQLGSNLVSIFQDTNAEAYDFPEIDFYDSPSIVALIKKVQPKLIINAAAYTAVDRAEEELEFANNINGQTVGEIAKLAREIQAGFIHYSTDYVFDGTKGDYYTEVDQPNPINVYGKSKLLGENKTIEAGGGFIILRLSWVYSLSHPSFATKVLEWSRKNKTLRIVDDQISNPTLAAMVAKITRQLVDRFQPDWYTNFQKFSGIYHMVGKGATSRYEWAKMILEYDPNSQEQLTEELLPAKSDEFPTLATRPEFTGLDCSKFEHTFQIELPDWKSSLKEAMAPSSS